MTVTSSCRHQVVIYSWYMLDNIASYIENWDLDIFKNSLILLWAVENKSNLCYYTSRCLCQDEHTWANNALISIVYAATVFQTRSTMALQSKWQNQLWPYFLKGWCGGNTKASYNKAHSEAITIMCTQHNTHWKSGIWWRMKTWGDRNTWVIKGSKIASANEFLSDMNLWLWCILCQRYLKSDERQTLTHNLVRIRKQENYQSLGYLMLTWQLMWAHPCYWQSEWKRCSISGHCKSVNSRVKGNKQETWEWPIEINQWLIEDETEC